MTAPDTYGKKPHPLFFGNIGANKTGRPLIKSVTVKEDINLEFFSFNVEMLEKIKISLAGFFAKTNFGGRQNKGFGSYYISEKDEVHFKPIETTLPGGIPYLKFRFHKHNADDGILSTIDFYYKGLKTFFKRMSTGAPGSKKDQFLQAYLDSGYKPSKGVARFKSPVMFKVYKDVEHSLAYVYILPDRDLIDQINAETREKPELFNLPSGQDIISFKDLLTKIGDHNLERKYKIQGTQELRRSKRDIDQIKVDADISIL